MIKRGIEKRTKMMSGIDLCKVSFDNLNFACIVNLIKTMGKSSLRYLHMSC